MSSWYDDDGSLAALAEVKGHTLDLQPAPRLRRALLEKWIPVQYARNAMRVEVTAPQWPIVAPLLPATLRAHVEAELPAWPAWVNDEQTRQGMRPADPLVAALNAGDLEVPDDHPWHRLYPYQRAGVRWLFATGLRAVLGDDMGLGKTPQAWMSLELSDSARLALVVCPGSVLENWVREGKRWAPGWTAKVAWSSKDIGKLVLPDTGRHAIIVSWGLMSREATRENLAKLGFDTVICDEAHYAKTPEAARTRGVLALLHAARHRMLLTGTPIKNRPAEFWTLLHAVATLRFHTFNPWGETFCGARDRRIGHKVVRTYDGNSRLGQLAKVTTPYVLRREKRAVLTDLPPKRRQRLVLPKNDELSALTRSVLEEVRAQAQSEREGTRALGLLGELRQHIGLAKIDAAVEWAQDARANDEPVVIFVYHREVGNQLKARLLKEGMRVGMILGDTPAKDRQSLVDAFQLRHHDDCVEERCAAACGVRQHGPLDILIGSEAIKEGITLVRAALSLQVEYWWSPGDLEQAEDRLCRNGQDRPVLNVYLHLDSTLDDHVAMLLEDKRDTVRQSLARDTFHKVLLDRLAGAS